MLTMLSKKHLNINRSISIILAIIVFIICSYIINYSCIVKTIYKLFVIIFFF